MKSIKNLLLLSFLLLSVGLQAVKLPKLSDRNLNIIVANDMGRTGISEQQNIANIMAEVAEENKIAFMAVAGDPIHYRGVQSIDDEEWNLKIESIYTAPSLHAIPWYVISGNHEYNGNVQAILDYSNVSERWNAPARYFSFEQEIGENGQKCLFVFIDTTPLINKYRSDAKYSDAGQQDMDAQLRWLEATLAASDAHWKIVIGHHPVYAGTTKAKSERRDMQRRVNPILTRNNVDLYICGHIHNFQHIRQRRSNVDYVVNSSASRSRKVKKNQRMLFGNPDPGFSVMSIAENKIDFFMQNHERETVYSFSIEK